MLAFVLGLIEQHLKFHVGKDGPSDELRRVYGWGTEVARWIEDHKTKR